MIVQICVGSSCHLKGSEDIVHLMEKAIEDYHLEDEIVLVGSFCLGKCSSTGITIQVDDDIYAGITRENFKEFFVEHIAGKIEEL